MDSWTILFTELFMCADDVYYTIYFSHVVHVLARILEHSQAPTVYFRTLSELILGASWAILDYNLQLCLQITKSNWPNGSRLACVRTWIMWPTVGAILSLSSLLSHLLIMSNLVCHSCNTECRCASHAVHHGTRRFPLGSYSKWAKCSSLYYESNTTNLASFPGPTQLSIIFFVCTWGELGNEVFREISLQQVQ